MLLPKSERQNVPFFSLPLPLPFLSLTLSILLLLLFPLLSLVSKRTRPLVKAQSLWRPHFRRLLLMLPLRLLLPEALTSSRYCCQSGLDLQPIIDLVILPASNARAKSKQRQLHQNKTAKLTHALRRQSTGIHQDRAR